MSITYGPVLPQFPNDEVFWLIWCPPNGNPTVQHFNLIAAIGEAQRLARKNPEKRFYVLEAKSYYQSAEAPVNEIFLRRD